MPVSVQEVRLYGVYDSTQNDSDDHVYQCAATVFQIAQMITEKCDVESVTPTRAV